MKTKMILNLFFLLLSLNVYASGSDLLKKALMGSSFCQIEGGNGEKTVYWFNLDGTADIVYFEYETKISESNTQSGMFITLTNPYIYKVDGLKFHTEGDELRLVYNGNFSEYYKIETTNLNTIVLTPSSGDSLEPLVLSFCNANPISDSEFDNEGILISGRASEVLKKINNTSDFTEPETILNVSELLKNQGADLENSSHDIETSKKNYVGLPVSVPFFWSVILIKDYMFGGSTPVVLGE